MIMDKLFIQSRNTSVLLKLSSSYKMNQNSWVHDGEYNIVKHKRISRNSCYDWNNDNEENLKLSG